MSVNILGRLISYILTGFLFVPFLSVPSYQWSFPSLNFWSKKGSDRFLFSNNLADDDSRLIRVLNFFPVPVEEECLSEDKRRRGLCLNTYECHIQQGVSDGSCALGFGVCCIFIANCDQEVQNNLTYIASPGFPNLFEGSTNCSVAIRKIGRHVTQLRIDFLHFNIGQPNKRSGVCDEDVMEIRNNKTNFRICGWNSGQHVYIDVDEDDTPVIMEFRLSSRLASRMWEIQIMQLSFEQHAPSGCLQYFQSPNGTVKTFNYLPNGRYIANHDYLICIRQERNMCGIAYTPCRFDSFRIGPPRFDMPSNSSTNNVITNSNMNSNMNSTVTSDMQIEGSGTELMDDDVMPVSPSLTSVSASMLRCTDRILIPCDFDEFITSENTADSVCNLEHCGYSLCDPDQLDSNGTCRLEIWAIPFRMRVSFTSGQTNENPLEENTGMCVTYEQLPCAP